MTLEEIKKLIDLDLDKAFEVLDTYFEGNATYNDFNREYINRPNNFRLDDFRSRLKRFIKFNKEVFEKGKEELSIPKPSKPITIKEPNPEPAPPSPPDKITKPVKVFLVFDPKDEKYAEELELHLFQSIKNREISVFNPHTDVPEDEKRTAFIQNELAMSSIVLLFASKNMNRKNTAKIVSQVETYLDQKRIVPIRVTDFDLTKTVFGSIQGLPLNGVSLDQQPNLDKAMMAVAKGVMNVVKRLLGGE